MYIDISHRFKMPELQKLYTEYSQIPNIKPVTLIAKVRYS